MLADTFDISPAAIKVPDIDTHIGLMHTLFTLEDRYGLSISTNENGDPILSLDSNRQDDNSFIAKMFLDWSEKSNQLKSGEISQDEYDNWRYHYPTPGNTPNTNWASVPSQGLSDLLIAELNKTKN